ncbi:hypothetical protein THAOC_32065 [Thalassiosira oceanica]|uniref:Uncharacterized protein n=1 Tax=Thalassiosira oceanica TaxID=159749 RepID=K0RJQ1_THAOC|nr:hypothetical protein THAOC_32065 [Thalassiosira oceanica]|eukprot:EJK49091.1 hypothetical protein THAOC_32065 [Thalassiosira oceanica]
MYPLRCPVFFDGSRSGVPVPSPAHCLPLPPPAPGQIAKRSPRRKNGTSAENIAALLSIPRSSAEPSWPACSSNASPDTLPEAKAKASPGTYNGPSACFLSEIEMLSAAAALDGDESLRLNAMIATFNHENALKHVYV